MNDIGQTAMETAVLAKLHDLYKADGFPEADSVRVLQRENTGGGRYVDIDADVEVLRDDGYLDLGGSFIEMSGIPSGMMAVVFLQGRRLRRLEFAVYGGDHWNGEEQVWKIV